MDWKSCVVGIFSLRELFFFDFLSYIIWRTPEFQIYLFIYLLDNSSLDTRCEETPV